MGQQKAASLISEARRLREESQSITHEIIILQQELRRTVKAVEKSLEEVRRTRPTWLNRMGDNSGH